MWFSIGNCFAGEAGKTAATCADWSFIADSNVSMLSVGGGDGVFPLCLLSVFPGACGNLYLTSRRNGKLFFFTYFLVSDQDEKHISISAMSDSVSQFVSS